MSMDVRYLRRRAAAKYLQTRYGFGAYQTLCKGAVTGFGPVYQRAGRVVVYKMEDLDRWAQSKLGEPQTSSSGAQTA
ncbi:hypothetical protein HUN39_09685 [Methylocystis sp. FS]|uniref:hypothetical protein n=1 Tax=Methylocystis silviterrae TaxID=2743612 RepID=UPI001583BD52|nr:hypothetical protein [Methylocystis silviterrae]NUJ80298.1 hypothetical protein [Methylocystis silviterrae]